MLHLLGVLPGLLDPGLDLGQRSLGLLLLLDDLYGGLPLSPGGQLPRLALLDRHDLLFGGSVVCEHLLVGHRSGRRHLKLLEVVQLVLYGRFEQDLGVTLLDPSEQAPEESTYCSAKSTHCATHPR